MRVRKNTQKNPHRKHNKMAHLCSNASITTLSVNGLKYTNQKTETDGAHNGKTGLNKSLTSNSTAQIA